MVKLSPDQAETILRAARPLGPSDGASFIEEVRSVLADFPEIGDGLVHRIIRDIQRKYFDPPVQAGHWARWR